MLACFGAYPQTFRQEAGSVRGTSTVGAASPRRLFGVGSCASWDQVSGPPQAAFIQQGTHERNLNPTTLELWFWWYSPV